HDTGTILQLQRCLVEADVLLQRRMGREPGSGGSWSDMSPSELESSTSGSDSSVSDGIPDDFHSPNQQAGTHRHPVLPDVQSGGDNVGEKSRASSSVTFSSAAGTGNGSRAIAREVPGADSGVAIARVPDAGKGHCATMRRHQLDSGTNAVTHHKPPLSPCHHAATSDSSRDPGMGAILGPSWQRDRDRARPLTVRAATSRCCACARQ
ncbi:hypothetical protein EK904_009405, partial [Melospiza melodia maxima]